MPRRVLQCSEILLLLNEHVKSDADALYPRVFSLVPFLFRVIGNSSLRIRQQSLREKQSKRVSVICVCVTEVFSGWTAPVLAADSLSNSSLTLYWENIRITNLNYRSRIDQCANCWISVHSCCTDQKRPQFVQRVDIDELHLEIENNNRFYALLWALTAVYETSCVVCLEER